MIRLRKSFKSVFLFLAGMMLLWSQMQAGEPLFPIPKMQVEWPSSRLSGKDYGLLAEAVKSVFADCDGGASDFRFEYALLRLGNLGKGVVVRTLGSCHCGGTGNCAIHVYIRNSESYREVPFDEHREPWGWAWGVVNSGSSVPELAFGSNGGGGCQSLSLYRYSKGSFISYAMEYVRLKDETHNPSPEDWWNPSAVVVRTSC